MIDDPLRPRGLRSHPFDAEGVATARRALVQDGVLTTWVLDCATARELGLRTTGNAQRGVSSAPSPGSPICISRPARSPQTHLIAGIADGFYVTDLIGMGANVVTGDYSRGAAGFWIERGEITYAVSEVTIAGHLARHVPHPRCGERSRLPPGHQCPDRDGGGNDRCWSVKAQPGS